MEFRSSYLVIGSGVAGLSFALRASKHGNVNIITKREVTESSTYVAQGGIASVWDAEDSFDDHIKDTLAAGAGICHKNVVELVIRDGPNRIKDLLSWGVQFSRRENSDIEEFDLGKEGGHSHRRIFHALDLTGREVERVLVSMVQENPNINIFEFHTAINLITLNRFQSFDRYKADECIGAYVLENRTGKIHTFIADSTILATGGSGKVYLYTSNPDIASGDGVAMAYRAGAAVANMEFVQFHPTCLYHPRAKSFLISEAVRGEGATLLRKDGRRFMPDYHEMAELAPRDIVARAIDLELKKRGEDYVLLDISFKPPEFVRTRFPNIHATCLQFGYDMTKEPLPVVPAAHYQCGGVLTDQNGETEIKRLFAAGETACTGLHGANRLASNSLLEALVFSNRAYEKSHKSYLGRNQVGEISIPAWDPGNATDPDELVVISHTWDEIRRLMWNYVGIVRSNKRLYRAKERIDLIKKEISEYYWNFVLSTDLIELRNIATVADLIIQSAIGRKESRGLHSNIDYPYRDDENMMKDTVLRFERFYGV
ncbi:MAG: L-aspartate oxidase [Deltaproteobacteria bacterium]|nr:L-aspartate oxidase [Deltaproteobacteria bacterium]NIS76557.1 L-aspartate oxidase [Deltaproteobacteria bacterium]